jgi:proprotein convertase subtilisin/kexin type 5
MYYPDHTDPTYYFCRSCPSNCQTCVSASTCTSCTTNYYLTTTGEYTLCVLAQDCVAGSYPDQDSGECLSCISNCAVCSGSTGCTTCFDGYFLHANTCVPNCPVSTYPMANGTCAPCITNCTACRDSLTCSQCAGGSSAGKIWLLEDAAACTFANSCPDGYFNSQQNNCSTCPPQCEKCNSRTVCTTCILNNYLNGMMCVSKCGNGLREDTEYCDDGNNYAGDGCAPDCTVEDGFICDQGVLVPPATSAPDTCRCDPSLVIA